MRTFEFSDAKSHKFWSIAVEGNAFTVTYGKIGTAGVSQTKSFASPDKARAEADKLVREKTGKGYAETTPKAASSDAEKFEKALAANPHNLTGWHAFADFLAEQNDPRGEFMQTQLALEDESRPPAERKKLQTREKALLKKHEREWLGGPLAAAVFDGKQDEYWKGRTLTTRPAVEATFVHGWLAKLRFHNLCVEEARALTMSKEAGLLRELVVDRVENELRTGTGESTDNHYAPGPDVPAGVGEFDGPGLHALCRCPHLKTVRVFQLGEYEAGKEGDFNCHTPGEPAHHLVKQMLDIEELFVLAHGVDANKLFALPMPKLRTLLVYHNKSYPLDKLAANKSLTNLTTLRTHPHALDLADDDVSGAYIRFAQLKAVCRSPHLPALTHLQLRLTDFGDKGAKEIVESGILKRLTVLDLQGGCMTDAGAKVLADCPDLKHLERLNLDNNALTKAGVALIRAAGVTASAKKQHAMQGEDFGGDDLPEYLFDGDIE